MATSLASSTQNAAILVLDEDYCYAHPSFSDLHAAKPMVDVYWDYVDKRQGNMYPQRMAFTQLVCCAATS